MDLSHPSSILAAPVAPPAPPPLPADLFGGPDDEHRSMAGARPMTSAEASQRPREMAHARWDVVSEFASAKSRGAWRANGVESRRAREGKGLLLRRHLGRPHDATRSASVGNWGLFSKDRLSERAGHGLGAIQAITMGRENRHSAPTMWRAKHIDLSLRCARCVPILLM